MDLSISLADSCGKLYGEKILKAMCGKNSSRKVTDYQFSLAEPKGDILLLIVEGMLLSGQIAQARYVFTKTNNFSEILSLEKTDVKYAWECPEILLLHNTGKSVAFGLKLEGQGLLTAIDDNYLYLLPGEIKRVHVQRDSQDQ
jgi:hypothetical protein